MRSAPNSILSLGFTAAASALALYSSVLMADPEAVSTPGSRVGQECGELWPTVPTHHFSIRAVSRASQNRFGDLLISLDDNADGVAEHVLRVHPRQDDALDSLLSHWNGAELEVSVQFWKAFGQTVVRVQPVTHESTGFLATTLSRQCSTRFVESVGLEGVPVVESLALGRNTLASINRLSHSAAMALFSDRPLISNASEFPGGGKD